MPAPDIIAFNADNLACYEQADIDEILVEHPALYLNHLRIEGASQGGPPGCNRAYSTSGKADDFQRGYIQALREVAAHLRQGDYVEGGSMIIIQQTPAEEIEGAPGNAGEQQS
jgi:hypothetical protein